MLWEGICLGRRWHIVHVGGHRTHCWFLFLVVTVVMSFRNGSMFSSVLPELHESGCAGSLGELRWKQSG